MSAYIVDGFAAAGTVLGSRLVGEAAAAAAAAAAEAAAAAAGAGAGASGGVAVGGAAADTGIGAGAAAEAAAETAGAGSGLGAGPGTREGAALVAAAAAAAAPAGAVERSDDVRRHSARQSQRLEVEVLPALRSLCHRLLGLGLLTGCALGESVQVEPMKPMLKPPKIKRSKLECDDPLSIFALKSNLRCYSWAPRCSCYRSRSSPPSRATR
jgi:hypothetical protein